MAGLNIPGVTDQYKTNDTIEKLMKVERIPLTREQSQLETLKAEKEAWRDVNSYLTSLRDKTKILYSYENPFNNKLTESSEQFAVTAEATRSAEIQSFKIDVLQPATADRFMSKELPGDYKIPIGTYSYKVGEKQININWKGGSIKEFSDAINKRSNGIIKSLVVGASGGKKTLLIEAIPTGKENKLQFLNSAKDLAYETDMIHNAKTKSQKINITKNDFLEVSSSIPEEERQDGMPELSVKKINIVDDKLVLQSRSGLKFDIPEKILQNKYNNVTLSLEIEEVQDITEELNIIPPHPELPDSGSAEFEGIVINNMPSDTQINIPQLNREPLQPINNQNILYAIMEDGSEKLIETSKLFENSKVEIELNLKEFEGIKSLAIKNENTSKILYASNLSYYDSSVDLGYEPSHPVTMADDAIIKYEGITISRPTNQIDDVVPEITINVKEKTDKTATISIKPDTEASKDALISFVGEYNQTLAKINVLSQNKTEIVDELDWLSKEEKAEEKEKLGMFQSDFSLTNIKSTMQSIISSGYLFSDTAEITMLSQIGIATNASGYSGGYSQSQLRGYLEIDEKKLDAALENHLDEIKMIFGYDTDGDLIVDEGIAYKLDKQISAYTQTGGILSSKTRTIDSKIKASETKIAKLEAQMDDKEAELRNKYSQMEGSLNSLEAQQNSISNFTRQQNRSN